MVDVSVKKTEKLNGKVCAPSSKSYTQRMLVAAALSNGTGKVSNPLLSEDTEATSRAIVALGATVAKTEDCWTVTGANPLKNANKPIDCGESGATLRFMVPVAALAPDPSILVFRGSLERRPIESLLQSLADLGANTHVQKLDGKDAVFVEGGGILGGKTSILGNVSSQFVSGLMLACPMAKLETEITIATPLESEDYVRMTQELIQQHGIRMIVEGNFERITIMSNQTYKSLDCKVPGDFSSAAFLLAAAAITYSNVQIDNLDSESIQGDRAILGILKQMGIAGKACENSVEINGTGNSLGALNIDAKNIPDLVPICAVLACYAEGTTRINGVQRLRFKESDRLSSLEVELAKMGAHIEMDDNSLIVKGPCALHGTSVDPHNDHRIAMACSIAALGAEGETTIKNAECVRKSYPQFFTHLKKIGAEIVGGKFDR
jgi:3-phosphoshikimate 1-carboxyvinyltransferase